MDREALKAVIDANQYMTLATADKNGRPWASPVWFASAEYRKFLWVSSPEGRHSRNISVRPEVAIVIFDSQQVPGTGKSVYLSATAEQVPEAEFERGLELYSTVSETKVGLPWTRSEVESLVRLGCTTRSQRSTSCSRPLTSGFPSACKSRRPPSA